MFAEVRAVVADDAEVSRRTLLHSLDRLGVPVVAEARDGVQALRACAAQRANLLITELVLPRLAGVDVIRVLLAQRPLQVLVVTGLCDKALHARCLALGAAAVLIKPTAQDELAEVISRIAPAPDRVAAFAKGW